MAPVLIGRDHPAGMLRAEIGRATGSHGGLVLVAGEAGIGKTALVTEAAEEARRLGALVLGGACWDSDSAPGYWPWVQVVRALRRAATAAEWAEIEAIAGAGLSVLLGETAASAGGRAAGAEATAAEAGAAGGDTEGFQLYDAVTAALVSMSQRRPVVVVLDDLHWADAASLRLLEFAAQHTWFERLLLVGTYRDVEVEWADHPLQPQMLSLVAKATTVTLTGLERAEVGALIARTVGDEPDDEVVAEVHRRTGGNPFFVEQTARLWRSGGSADTVAPGVRDAVRRRLSLLPEPVESLLTVAAVLGREFHRRVLAAVAAAPVPQTNRLLEQAVAARLVTGHGGGRFAFAHDLVRETLYAELDETGARHLHAAVVRALDRSDDLKEQMLPAELARHAHLAGDELDAARAVDLMMAAARHASARLATEEAIGHYRRALERTGADGPADRVRVALALGQELHHWGDKPRGWQAFDEAVAVVRDLDDAELLARVALTLYGYTSSGDRAKLQTELLREAHRKLVVGGAAASSEEPEEAGGLDRMADELAMRVAVLARRGNDDEALGESLWARHHAIWGLGTAAVRVELTDELLNLARRTSDDEMAVYAGSLRWVALLEQGDPRFLDQFHSFVTLAERTDLPRADMASMIDRSIIYTMLGRFQEAEELYARAIEAANRHQHDQHMAYLLHQHRWALLLLQGRFEELEEVHRTLEERAHPHPQLLRIVTELERGLTGSALRRFREASAPADPRDRSYEPFWLRVQAQVAAVSQDPVLCERARAAIAPYAGQWAVSMFGWDVSGPFDLWLALIDAAQERWDEAIGGLTAAYRSADRMRARPWSIDARTRLAEVLLTRGAPGDAAAAAELLNAVESEAAEIGMRHIAGRVRNLRSSTAPEKAPASAPPPAGGRASAAGPASAGTREPAAGPGAVAGQDSPGGLDSAGGPGRAGASGVVAGPGSAGDLGSAGGSGVVAGPGSAGDLSSADGPRAPGASDELPVLSGEFRFDGQVWSLAWGGRTVHMPDAKGLRDLHFLLGSPGTDIPAVQLLDPGGGAVVVAARRMGGDAVLDDEAKASYKRRLSRLDEEIDRATELGDDRRAMEYDQERAALLAELRAAAGLAGRSRRLGDESERARKTVTARIRDTLRKLDQRHPELAAHLRATVSTGATCSYRPDTGVAWQL